MIAVGGGSPIDLGKAVALLATHEGPLEQYALILGGLAKITAKVAPLIAVPTTAGTGSEVGRGALITLRDGRKLGFISPHMIPKVALCDPELTLGLPRGAHRRDRHGCAHALHRDVSLAAREPAGRRDRARWRAARRTLDAQAVDDGGNRDARWNMMMASLQGGLTFQKGLGAVHSMSHPLGGLKDAGAASRDLERRDPARRAALQPFARRGENGRARKCVERAAGERPRQLRRGLNAEIGLPRTLRRWA